jgi:GST-like protein
MTEASTSTPDIELFAAATPNGRKITIMLELLGVPYTLRPMNLGALEQKQDWYLKINPNGRIPTIIDHSNGDFPVFESGAILIYLAEKYGKFLPTDAKKKSQVIQWLMFQMSGIGPMQGQAELFVRFASEKIPYAIERYQKETRRLYEVLNKQLAGRDYIVDELSIADIATFPWVNGYKGTGLSIDGLDNVKAWLERMKQHEGVRAGLEKPPSQQTADIHESAKKLLPN